MTIDQQFWEQKHALKDSTWLSGNPIDMYYKWFGLGPEQLQHKDILEIGVGLGYASAQLSAMASKLYCADISEEALRRVAMVATGGCYQTMDIRSIPPVDIAICHLVMVHCNDQEVSRIISDVNLAPEGKLFVQISGPGSHGLPQRVETEWPSGSHFFRTLEHIQDIVSQTNKKILQ